MTKQEHFNAPFQNDYLAFSSPFTQQSEILWYRQV